MTRSLGVRLTLTFTLLCAISLSLLSLVLYSGLSSALASDLDRALVSMARLESASAVDDPKEGVHLHDGVIETLSEAQGYTEVAQILDGSGKVLAQTETVRETLTVDPVLLQSALQGETVFATVELSGHPYRLIYQPFRAAGKSYLMILGTSAAGLERTLEAFRNRAALVLLAGVFLSMLAAGLLSRRLVAPLANMLSEITTLATDQRLQARLGGNYSDRETESLQREINRLLDRIESLFAEKNELLEAQRRMLADTSHELRSPLSNLRTSVEVVLRRQRSPEEYRETLHTALGEIERLSRLCEDLLTLGRLEHGQLPLSHETFEVHALLQERATIHQARADSKQVSLSVSPANVRVRADRARLGQVVDNLLDNAIAYSPSGAEVCLSCQQVERGVEIEVIDQGPGLSAPEREKIFERFYRVDPSRQRRSGGTGLGLAIARALVEAHCGTIEAAVGGAGGLAVKIRLPDSGQDSCETAQASA